MTVTLSRSIKPRAFIALVLFESILTFLWSFLIPRDPKNAFIFGFSLSRFILLCILSLLIVLILYLLTNKAMIDRMTKVLIASDKNSALITYTGVIAAFLIWIVIWLPANRLLDYQAVYTRIRPLITFLLLLTFQIYYYRKIVRKELPPVVFRGISFKKIAIFVGAIIFIISTFLILRSFPNKVLENQLIFPPGAPLTALQVFLSWIVFIGLYLTEVKKNHRILEKKLTILICAVFIFIAAIVVWKSTPVDCSDDLVGPYPPNDRCYSDINDAGAAIGSHYIRLGEGIFNHWMTDKPLYYSLLAIGQWVFGPSLQEYINIQFIVTAIIPALLFLISKRYLGYSGGFFVAGLFIIRLSNSVLLYRQAGSVNVWLENNSEFLTELFLVLFFIFLHNWIENPQKQKWAILSGGIIGLATLVRFYPAAIFICTFVFAIIFFLLKKRKMLKAVVLYAVAYVLVISPWILTARYEDGRSFYWIKFQNVISTRYESSLAEDQPLSVSTESEVDIFEPVEESDLVTTAIQSTNNTTIQGDIKREDTSRASIVENFFNNEISLLGILPVNFRFISMREIINQPIWDFSTPRFFWDVDFSLENYIFLITNLVILVMGVMFAVKKYKLAGLTGFLLQAGYFLGASISKVSGGRHLEPVLFTLLLYYVNGIFVISKFVLSWLGILKADRAEKTLSQDLTHDVRITKPPHNTKSNIILLAVLFSAGMLVVLFNNLPSRLSLERSPEFEQTAYDAISSRIVLPEEDWETFIQDPNAYVVKGQAFSPQYYRSTYFNDGNLSFELLILARDHVYNSYLINVEPEEYFSDGSRVILVGCKVRADNNWAAERIVLRTLALIQLDYEEMVYIDPQAEWSCDIDR